jgi:hypothetical protein
MMAMRLAISDWSVSQSVRRGARKLSGQLVSGLAAQPKLGSDRLNSAPLGPALLDCRAPHDTAADLPTAPDLLAEHASQQSPGGARSDSIN